MRSPSADPFFLYAGVLKIIRQCHLCILIRKFRKDLFGPFRTAAIIFQLTSKRVMRRALQMRLWTA